MSDYDIEFTRLNKTDQGLSSLSSLNIPLASNTSLSVLSNNTTPRQNAQNRKSSNIPRRSGHYTPSQLLRQRQSAYIDMAERQNRDSVGNHFLPHSFSTPILSQRKKSSIFEHLAGAETSQNKLIDSVSNLQASEKQHTLTTNGNTSTPKNRTYRMVTQQNQIVDSELTLVPAANPSNESIIPETQDDQERQRNNSVPNARKSVKNVTVTINVNTSNPMNKSNRTMTQANQIDDSDSTLIPETQSTSESVIPETQDDQIPETQEERLPDAERNNGITSTPTRSQRRKSSIHGRPTEAETSRSKLSDSVSNARASVKHDTITIDRNTLTPKNKTNQMVTQENQIDDSGPSLAPETQPENESVIPETQDDEIPETQEEQLPETERDNSDSNDRASDTHRNTPTPTNKKNRTLTRRTLPVVLLSPLSDEIMQKHNRKVSVVPMDLVFTPPTNFQNSRRTSRLENDDLIVEASPSTCEFRKKQLEQRNFDQVCSLFILIYHLCVLIKVNIALKNIVFPNFFPKA